MAAAPDETCWTLLRDASAGDGDARSLFVSSYAAPVRAYLAHRWRGSTCASEVDDAVQDVFVECMKPGGVLDRADPERGDFRALLYGVARNVARRIESQVGRSARVQAGDGADLDAIPTDEASLSRVFDRNWAQALLREAVLRHARAARHGDDDDRRRYRILRLRHQQGLPIREVARQLGEPDVESVHNAYRRARREFRTHLREVVARHTGVGRDSLDAECRRITELLGS